MPISTQNGQPAWAHRTPKTRLALWAGWLSLAALFVFALGQWVALAWLLAAALLAVLFGAYCRKRVGGITGDLLGTTSELTETFILFLPMMVCVL